MAFCIDLRSVTAAEYRQCIESKKCGDPRAEPAEKHPRGPAWNQVRVSERCRDAHAAESAGLAINCVTWKNAYDYCRWRHASLPSEEEWQAAHRTGLLDTTSIQFNWTTSKEVAGDQYRAVARGAAPNERRLVTYGEERIGVLGFRCVSPAGRRGT